MTDRQSTIVNHKQLNLFYMIMSIEVWKKLEDKLDQT